MVKITPGEGRRTSSPEVGPMSDFSVLLRGSLLNAVGSVVSGALNLLVFVIAARGLHTRGAGFLFEAVAFFAIAWNFATLGADVAVIKDIPSHLTNGKRGEVWRTLAIALAPVILFSIGLSVASGLLAIKLSRLFSPQDQGAELAMYIRMLSIFIPVSTSLAVILAATRAFGTMIPSVILDKIGRPALQVVLLILVMSVSKAPTFVALAWTIPYCVTLIIAFVWVVRLTRGVSTVLEPAPPASHSERARQFWRFAGPRSLASLLSVLIAWLDTLFLGALRSPHDAAVYTAATRFIVLGLLLSASVVQVIGPQISGLLAVGKSDRVEALYQRATAWLTASCWPVYFVLAIYAPIILRVFGAEFVAGQSCLTILSLAMLVSIATGPVDWVLLMAGKSSWNLLNVASALAANILLNLLLIPHLGLAGAAIAWAASILINNIAPALEVWLLLGLKPFGSEFVTVASGSTLCFGVIGLLSRLFLGSSLISASITVSVGAFLYVMLLYNSQAKRLLQLSAS